LVDHIYVFTKNEAANIDRCLAVISEYGVPISVLDSGSSDDTPLRAGSYKNVTVQPFNYTNHCDAYNSLTSRHEGGKTIVILDADMRPEPGFLDAVDSALEDDPSLDVVIAPISMYWAGSRLKHGSLYPPKPAAFRGGNSYFEPVGHGERLIETVRATRIDTAITHDDQRPFDAELLKQWNYAITAAARVLEGRATLRDRVRNRSPLMLVVTPFVSYVLKLGFMSGRIGILYAVDRIIAEALVYRAGLIARIQGRGDN
jgi:glycosyltransferase involved in cell wall biosynthesis